MRYYFDYAYNNLIYIMLHNTIYISVIPTLLYTWHNFDVLSRAAGPSSSNFWYYLRFTFTVAICSAIVIVPKWQAIFFYHDENARKD